MGQSWQYFTNKDDKALLQRKFTPQELKVIKYLKYTQNANDYVMLTQDLMWQRIQDGNYVLRGFIACSPESGAYFSVFFRGQDFYHSKAL